jgi:5'-deoxynucleotidase YfbR-like HD superfamily hydrolase
MKIFLSHSSADKKFVRKIANALESQGYKIWFDEIDILIGESITDEIGEGLQECDVVLVFLSNHSVASRWFKTEWQTKFFEQVNKGGVYILPLLVEQCEIPLLLRDKKFADFSSIDAYENSLSMLLRTLRRIEMQITEDNSAKTEINESIFEHTKEMLNELKDESIILPILGSIPIVDTLKKIKRSGKLVRLENYSKPKIRIRSIYDHTLSVAYLADCLLPVVNSGVTAEKYSELARIITFHEFNETILGDIPSYTNLKEKNRDSSANPAEQTLRSVAPDLREKIANDFIWMFLSEKHRLSLESVLTNLLQTQSNLVIFFKMLDKIDPIVSIWRYLNYYRGQLGDIKEFLNRLIDFFEYPGVRKYAMTTQFGDQLSDFISLLQNRKMAEQYYFDPNIFKNQSSLYQFTPSIIKKIIEGCPLFFDDTE